MSIALLMSAVWVSTAAAQSTLEKAAALEQQGKLNEARDLFHQAEQELRASGDQSNLAIALSEAGNISVHLGDYAGAIRDVQEAIKLRESLHEDIFLSEDFTAVGLAYEGLGNYAAAVENYEQALKFDRLLKKPEGEITRLNNIGNANFYQGRYVTALENYQDALQVLNANTNQPWYGPSWKFTTGNIATLYQRLGMEQQALALYQQISSKAGTMQPDEYARFLLNEGVLYRHLGDPIKALEVYHTAQETFRTARHADGEIKALRNIGIAKTMDLNDLNGAIKDFTAALELSQRSSNTLGMVQANLYLGELLRRQLKYKRAVAHLEAALAGAQKAGLVEEQWKTLYVLGRIAEQTGSSQTAREDYQKAISIIESVRAGLRITALRTDFLADKRDVYDALIASDLQQPNPSADEIFHWMERSRARTLQDRIAARTLLKDASLKSVQLQLPPDTVLVEFWMANQDGCAVWMTAAESGIVRLRDIAAIRETVGNFLSALQTADDQWKKPSQDLGVQLLTGIPIKPHLIIVPDSPLDIPFEALSVSGSQALLIEQSDVSYLPSSRLVAMTGTSSRRWRWPWNRQLVAIGDPPVSSTDELAQEEHWQPLPASATEVRDIAGIIPGRAEIHLGADARKAYLLGQSLEGVPLLHLSTHALVDSEHPEHSRILLASAAPMKADYLFQEEVTDLDLKNVGLVTISACDTARGKAVAGEGTESFSQAFLAAGASATITSLWKVADEPTASFMGQVYYSLARGVSKAEALQATKLQFLHSHSALSSPRYWAAFVLNGDGWRATDRVIPWSAILFVPAAVLAAIGLVLWRFLAPKAGKKARQTAQLSR